MTDQTGNLPLHEDVHRMRRIREIDLDMFEGLTDEQMRQRLAGLARDAGAVGLRAFLGGSVGGLPEDDDLDALVERYVERRMRTIQDMLHLKSTFRFEDER